MTLEKSVLTNYTSMSLDERFTQLRRSDSRLLVSGLTDLRQQFASAKSRRLALQMSRRPAVIAALNTRRNFGSGISRRGQIGRGRGGRNLGLISRTNGSFRGNNRLRRSSSVGLLSRSSSLQSLNNSISPSQFRRGRRGRGDRAGGRGGRGNRGVVRNNNVGGVRGGRVGMRGRGQGQGRGGIGQRRSDNIVPRRGGGGRGRGGFPSANSRGRGKNGVRRGNNPGRGGRGGRRGGQREAPPSKEKLDMELDEYMASSRATLDKEIDSYMSQTQEKWE